MYTYCNNYNFRRCGKFRAGGRGGGGEQEAGGEDEERGFPEMVMQQASGEMDAAAARDSSSQPAAGMDMTVRFIRPASDGS